MEHPDWAPADIDWRKPSPARVYDVHLGGAHNFAADREVAAQITAIMPELPELLRANRSFLRRAVRFLAESGIRQFLDLGSGIPTAGNVHEIAQELAPTSTVVYVDSDPVAVAHGHKILATNPRAIALQADLRSPQEILSDPEVRRLLDFSEPIAVLMVAVLHFVPDSDDPAGVVAEYMDALAPGSHLVISHGTPDPGARARQVEDATELYSRSVNNFHLRDPDQVTRLFGPLELIDPGVVCVTHWRPDAPVTTDPVMPQVGAVARKPGA